MLTHVLGDVLERLISGNEMKHLNCGRSLSCFNGCSVPDISIADYLLRIQNFAECHESCLVIAMIYVDRLLETGSFSLSLLNVHRVMLTSIMVAIKTFDDCYYNNAFYAKSGGISASEISVLEIELLKYLNFHLYVRVELYETYFQKFKSYRLVTLSRGVPPIISGASYPAINHPEMIATFPIQMGSVNNGFIYNNNSVISNGQYFSSNPMVTPCQSGNVSSNTRHYHDNSRNSSFAKFANNNHHYPRKPDWHRPVVFDQPGQCELIPIPVPYFNNHEYTTRNHCFNPPQFPNECGIDRQCTPYQYSHLSYQHCSSHTFAATKDDFGFWDNSYVVGRRIRREEVPMIPNIHTCDGYNALRVM